MKTILLSVSFLISGISIAQNYSEAPVMVNARELIEKGIKSYDDEKYDEALSYYLQIPENDTAYPLAVYESALTYRILKKPQEAIKLLNKGISMNTVYKRSYYEMLGNAYDESGDFENSIKTFRNGLKEFPCYDFFYNEMGITYLGHKDGDSALVNLIKAVQINPIRAVNHLKLSGFLLKNNQLVPAMMAFLVYSSLETNTSRAFKQLAVYEKVLKKEESFDPDSVLKFNFNAEQFSEVDQIVKSNMAVSKDYKVPVKLNYPYLIKNFYVMMEKIQVNKSNNDIWNSFYIEILKKVYDEDKFEPFILNIFATVDREDVQKEVKKKKKAIEGFNTWMVQTIYEKYMKNKAAILDGKTFTDILYTYYGDGSVSSIGNYDEGKKISTGMHYYYYKNGNIRAKGEYDNEGKKTGEWQYFTEEGQRRSIEVVKAGVADGPYSFYYPNGNIKEKGIYVNGDVDGELSLYYPGGALKKVTTYKKGKADGKIKEYTDDDLLNQISNISAENGYDGETKKYFRNGNINYTANYKKGLFDGSYKTYYQNTAVLKEEGAYSNDKRTGKLKVYFESGKLKKEENSYENGKLTGTYTTYFENGKISEKGKYENDLLNGEYINYDSTGKMYAKYVYEKNNLKKATYYGANNKVIDEIQGSSKKFYFKNYRDNGVIYEEGNVIDNKREGLWKQYYSNGNLHSEYNYTNNILNGVYKTYFIHGAVKSEVNYTDGERDGLYKEYFPTGVLKQQGWNVKGTPEQNFYNYSCTGVINSDIYVFHNERQGPMKNFDVTGKLNYIEYYEKGVLYKVESYDTLGKLINVSEIKNGTGKLIWYHLNGKVNAENDYKNGYEHGTEKILHNNGKVSVINNSKNGMKFGSYKTYDTYGKAIYESYYKNDLLDSTYTQYDFDGYKVSEMVYKFGDLNGVRNWYYPNGKVETTGSYKDDSRHGAFNYYAPDGTLMIQKKYIDGTFVSFTYQNSSGQLLPPVMVNDKMQKVDAYYANGKKSVEITLVDGLPHGELKEWYPNGNKKSEYNRFYNDYDGMQKEYYENGKIKSEEIYKNDKLSGECKYYYDTGKIKRITNYLNDVKHGHEILYDKLGKKTSDIVFYNGESVN